MQLTNDAMTVFKYELAPIPTCLFNDDGDMRVAKSKADLKNALGCKISTRGMGNPQLTVIDGSATMWVINWPTKASVSDYLDNFCSYILQRIEAGNTNLFFDRYYDFSIKSSTRSGLGKSISRTY